MAYVRRFILMLQFLTAIPLGINVKAERDDFGKGLALAPLIGLLIGFLLAVADYLLGLLFPPVVAVVLTIVLYIWLTGGLHLDGLGDTADGLFSNRSRERMLEIMKDSRAGTNAVLALILVILLYVTILASLQGRAFPALLLMPVAGRLASLLGAGSSGYAGVSDGPGRWCVECCGKKEMAVGLGVYAAIFAAAGAFFLNNASLNASLTMWKFVLLAFVPPASALLLTKILGRKLKGVTGDILGAICELNQVIFLIAVLLFSSF